MHIFIFGEHLENEEKLAPYFSGAIYKKQVDGDTGDIYFSISSQEENTNILTSRELRDFGNDNIHTNNIVILSLNLVRFSRLQRKDGVQKVLDFCSENPTVLSSTVFAIYTLDDLVKKDIVSNFKSLIRENYSNVEGLENLIDKLIVLPLNPETRNSYNSIMKKFTVSMELQNTDLQAQNMTHMMHYFSVTNETNKVFDSVRKLVFKNPHLAFSALVGFMYYYRSVVSTDSANLLDYKTFFETAGLTVITKMTMDSVDLAGKTLNIYNTLSASIEASTQYNQKFYKILTDVESVVEMTKDFVSKAQDQKEFIELVNRYSDLGSRLHQTLDDLHGHVNSAKDQGNNLINSVQTALSRIVRDFHRTTKNFDKNLNNGVSDISDNIDQIGKGATNISGNINTVTKTMKKIEDDFGNVSRSAQHEMRKGNETFRDGVKIKHRFCAIL